MSHFATPFIVVNLGCEMIYVIDQRLKAQDITSDKSDQVLTDITTVLLHPKLLAELFIPQPVATHSVIKQLLQDISATSIMKLDDYSLSKLWDLMTIIFKWQLTIATNQNIFDITRQHLNGVTKIMPKKFSKFIIEHAIKKFETLAQGFTDDDYGGLRNTMMLWLSEYHTKISVLLRLGLQRKNGTFSLPATIDPRIVNNLGENIYDYDNKKNLVVEYEKLCADTNEISCLLAPIEKGPLKQTIELQLPITFGNRGQDKKSQKCLQIPRDTQFQAIDTDIKSKNTDLTYTADEPKSAKEDLLALLNSETSSGVS